MPDPFVLPHYFIVFHPGSAGNFIANIVRNLVNSSLDKVEINSTGSSHNTTSEKINKTDYLACGTFLYENSIFSSFEQKLEFHKNRIKQLSITSPNVNWTHDFTNIPLYKILFPKAKILVVTQETIPEKLTTTILQIHKNFLDKDNISPANSDIKNEQEKRWEKWASPIISKILGSNNVDLIATIIQDRHNPIYKDLIEYVTLYGKMKYYNLLQYLNDPPYEKDLANTVLYPIYNDPIKRYNIGNDYNYYYDGCVKIPYSIIMNNEASSFLKVMEDFVGEINDLQKQYIIENFNRYYVAQDKTVFIDPKQYILNLRQRAFNLAKQL